MGLFEPAEMAEFYAMSQIEDAYWDDWVEDYNEVDELCKYADVENIIDAIIINTNNLYCSDDKYLNTCYNIFEFYNNNGYITDKQKMVLCRYCVYNHIGVKI